jgi:hypothetical protein
MKKELAGAEPTQANAIESRTSQKEEQEMQTIPKHFDDEHSFLDPAQLAKEKIVFVINSPEYLVDEEAQGDLDRNLSFFERVLRSPHLFQLEKGVVYQFGMSLGERDWVILAYETPDETHDCDAARCESRSA